MTKLFFSTPLFLATAVVAPFAFAGECENPVEKMDPLTYEIYKVCPDESYYPTPYPEPEYDYFNEEYTRVVGVMKDVETSIVSFAQDIEEMTDAEKRMAYYALLSSVSEHSDLGYSIQNINTYYYTDTEEEKAMVKALGKQQKALEKEVKKLKKTLNILSVQEFDTIDSVQESFGTLSENVAEAKEIYTLILPDLSEMEKKNAKKALKVLDHLYAKAKKQADIIEKAVLALPEDKDPWTLQTKYHNAEYRVTRVLDKVLDIVSGSEK